MGDKHAYSPEGTSMSEPVDYLARAFWTVRLEAGWLAGSTRLTRRLAGIDPNVSTQRMVGPHTDICIEGCPRSANTFSVACLTDSNPDLNCGRHIHKPLQVREAVRLGIPAGVVIRNPVDAVVSRIAFSGNTLSPNLFIRHWIGFYEPLLESARRGEFLVLPFEKVISDPDYVIASFNRRFDLELAAPKSSPEELLDRGGNRPSAKIFASTEDREVARRMVEALPKTAAARKLYGEFLPLAAESQD